MGEQKNIALNAKRALVTGGGGFVGGAIVQQLAKIGIETSVIGRNRYSELEARGIRCIVGDIRDGDAINKATEGVDIVFHVAAKAGIWGNKSEYYSTNVVGTQSVLEGCRKNGVPHLVYTSTPSVVFAGEDIINGNEDLPYARKFLCHYAWSKVIAEKLILSANDTALKTTALRPHLIWGPGDPHLLPRLLASGRKKNLKIVGSGENLVDISYVDNVALAHLLAAKDLTERGLAAGKAYFVSQGEPVNLWAWINELYSQLGIDNIRKSISYTSAYRIGFALESLYRLLPSSMEPRMTRFLAEQLAKSHYFSIDRARDELNYSPAISTEEGLSMTVRWLKENEK